MKTIGCIIARTSSTRLPQKVLKKISDKMLVEYIIEKCKYVSNLDEIFLCTSIDEDDEILLNVAKNNKILGYAGDRDSIISRMLDVAELEGADNVVRITGDNIFTDEIFLETMIDEHIKNSCEYTRTEYLSLGVTAEVIDVDALKRCHNSINPKKSEYLLLYLFDPNKYECQVVIPEKKLWNPYSSLTVDTQEDFERSKYIIDKLYINKRVFYDDIIELDRKNPIPYFRLGPNLPVKLPNNNVTTLIEFRRNILEKRIKMSRKVQLGDGYYESKKSL